MDFFTFIHYITLRELWIRILRIGMKKSPPFARRGCDFQHSYPELRLTLQKKLQRLHGQFSDSNGNHSRL
jgi:hypothetical protein